MMSMLNSRNNVFLVAAICCTIVGFGCVSAFTSTPTKTATAFGAASNFYTSSHHVAFRLMTPTCNTKFRKLSLSSSIDDEDPNAEEDYRTAPLVEKIVAPVETVEEESSLPLDVPSPILLGSSVILAIAGTGSLFQLIGGDPPNGSAVTASIIVVSLPLCAFLFYAALKKGQAETDADDAEFRSKNRGRF